MPGWLRGIMQSAPQSIHPPWQAGQYVSYFLERADGVWYAFALRLLGQTENGDWVVCGDFKAPLGEMRVWFRQDQNAPPGTLDLLPAREEYVRKLAADSSDPNSMELDPWSAISMAMNLLMVRCWPEALQSLRSPARAVSYPCDVRNAHLLVTPGPGYEKHHDIDPRVMLTGVACLSVNGGLNPILVTSFGHSDPDLPHPVSFDDFVDLSHPKTVVHDGFSLAYPATWFLQPRQVHPDRANVSHGYSAQVGGNSFAISLSVYLYHDSAPLVAQELEASLQQLGAPMESPMGLLHPRADPPVLRRNDLSAFVFDLENEWIQGITYSAVGCNDAGDRLVQIILTGNISRANPCRATAVPAMELAFQEILESFQFQQVSGGSTP